MNFFYFRAGDGECLFNKPSFSKNILNNNLKFEDTFEQFDDTMIQYARFPGLYNHYTLKNQCQQIFGIKSDKCDHNPVKKYNFSNLLNDNIIIINKIRRKIAKFFGVEQICLNLMHFNVLLRTQNGLMELHAELEAFM